MWRSDDHGAPEAALVDKCNAMHLDPGRGGCGDWAAIGQNLTQGFALAGVPARAGHYVVATTRAEGDDGTLWAGTRIGRVFVSKNADADAAAVTFTRIDKADTPTRFVSGIALDPADPNHAWISFSGYAAYTPGEPGHVFSVRYNPAAHSATWTDITRNIGDQPVTAIAENADTGDLYAGTASASCGCRAARRCGSRRRRGCRAWRCTGCRCRSGRTSCTRRRTGAARTRSGCARVRRCHSPGRRSCASASPPRTRPPGALMTARP